MNYQKVMARARRRNVYMLIVKIVLLSMWAALSFAIGWAVGGIYWGTQP